MNSVNLIGRLVADPQVLITRDDKKIAKFSLAVKRIDRNNANEVDFINCFTVGKNAENVEKYLKKGSQVGATGQIRTNKYQKNNETRYSFEIFLEKIYFISQKNEEKNLKNDKNYSGNNWEIIEEEKNLNNFNQKNFRNEQKNKNFESVNNNFNQNEDEYFNDFEQYDGIDLSSDDLPF